MRPSVHCVRVVFFIKENSMPLYNTKIKAYAKINLFLRICGKRPDGYHLLSSLMQSVSLYDTVTVACSDTAQQDGFAPGITLSSDADFVPTDSRNTAYKAARLFLNALGRQNVSVRIHIEKGIPTQAGMAGGSTDAAAVLKAMSGFFPHVMDRPALLAAAARIGADVPFCLDGGTQLCEGVGEILTPVAPLTGLPLLFIKPPCSISTPWAFSMYDQEPAGYEDLPGRDAAISRFVSAGTGADALQRLTEAAPYLYNDLESVSDRQYPVLTEVRSYLTAKGAVLARMSGSGSTLFGVFADTGTRDAALTDAEAFYGKDYFIRAGETI